MTMTEPQMPIMGWNGPIAVLDVWCGELDRRMFHEIEWPDLPRSMGSSHYSDESVGTVDEIRILTADDGTRYVWGRGRFSHTEDGVKAAAQVADGSLRTVSVEIRDGSYTEWPLEDNEGEIVGWAMEWERAVIGAFALERNPAFAGAVIVPDSEAAGYEYVPPETPNPSDGTAPDDGERPETEPNESEDEFDQRMATIRRMRVVSAPEVVRAAGAGPVAMPARYFTRDLDYGGPCRLAVSPDGEVTGYGVIFGETHRANSNWKATACGDLSDWLVGTTLLDNGEYVATGVIVSDGLHAPAHPKGSSSSQIARLIESTATQIASVVAWEDEHGMAVHGSLLPGVTPEQATRALAGCPSVDQRDFGDGRGFVTCGLLIVNTCGFRPASAVVTMQDGEPVRRLVASALPEQDCGCGGSGEQPLPGPWEGSTPCSCQSTNGFAMFRQSLDVRVASADQQPEPEPTKVPVGKLREQDAAWEKERLRAAVAPSKKG